MEYMAKSHEDIVLKREVNVKGFPLSYHIFSSNRFN